MKNKKFLFPHYLGAQVDTDIGAYANKIIDGRMYQSPVRWTDVEKVQGMREYPFWLRNNISAFRSNPFILGFKTCPEWARLWKDKPGSPPMPEYYEAFGNFIVQTINLYRPWGVEIWNETDVPNTLPNDLQWWFGAWVEGSDYFGAGKRYGEMMNVIYPIIKKTFVKVLAGAVIGAMPSSIDFLRGAMSVNMPTDIISIHKYLNPGDNYSDLYKLADAAYSAARFPIAVTETNVKNSIDSQSLKDDQVEYLKWILANDNPNIHYVQLYSWNNGWEYTNVVNRPVYDIFKEGK